MAPKATGVERRTLHFGTFDDAKAEARRLLKGPYARAGEWSLGQNCEHLAAFMRYSLDGFPKKLLPWPINALLRRVALRESFFRKPMPAGLPTAPFLKPSVVETPAGETASRADAEAVERFCRECDRVAERQAAGGRFEPSPIFGEMRGDLWPRVHLKHAELHLGHIVPVTP